MNALLVGTAVGLAVLDTARRWPCRAPVLPRVAIGGRRARRWAAVAGLVVTAVVLPPAAGLLLLAWWTTRRVRARRATEAQARQVRRALPELVDLLMLATTAGLSLPIAHPLLAAHAPAPLRLPLAAAHEATMLGRPRADALVAALAPLGERAHALGHVLGDHLRYGVPLLPALERAGMELRLDRRRRAELDARRVPVRLLGPLVTCVLPAFALLTVVPLLAASLDALPT